MRTQSVLLAADMSDVIVFCLLFQRLSTLSDMQIDDSELLYAAWRYEARSVILGEVTRLVEEEWMSQVVDHIASTVCEGAIF